jgi:hypothetical protein
LIALQHFVRLSFWLSIFGQCSASYRSPA